MKHYVYQKDSAFLYALNIKNIADTLQNKQFQNKALITFADLCISGRMYKKDIDY